MKRNKSGRVCFGLTAYDNDGSTSVSDDDRHWYAVSEVDAKLKQCDKLCAEVELLRKQIGELKAERDAMYHADAEVMALSGKLERARGLLGEWVSYWDSGDITYHYSSNVKIEPLYVQSLEASRSVQAIKEGEDA